jgi:small conductance mechanosensitive channel
MDIDCLVASISTMDNVKVMKGNNAIFADPIQNLTVNPHRWADLVAQLDHTVDLKVATAMLKQRLGQILNRMTEPALEVDILTFMLAGPVLSVRFYGHCDRDWQVWCETHQAISDSGSAAGFSAPISHCAIHRQVAVQVA